jgi:hypothetical protein
MKLEDIGVYGAIAVGSGFLLSYAIKKGSCFWLIAADFAVTPVVDTVAKRIFAGTYPSVRQFITRAASITVISSVAVAFGLPITVAWTTIKVVGAFRVLGFIGETLSLGIDSSNAAIKEAVCSYGKYLNPSL